MTKVDSNANPSSAVGVSADPMTAAESTTAQEMREDGSLSHHTARGFAWMTSQAVATKVLTFLGQIVILWYLLPEQVGLVSIAYMFCIVPVVIQQGGLKEVLIARHAHFRRWANPAFWMAMAMGTSGGLLMLIVAPVAARVYNQPTLFGLLLVISLLFPLDSLSIVPLARIQIQMRFRLVAAIEMGRALMLTALTILLARWGFGPFSLVVPRVIVSVIVASVCWIMAPVPVRLKPQIRRWRFLMADGALVITANGCDLLMQYIGPFFLSIRADTRVVGLFWFASYHSTQATGLITYQLGSVLFPALAKLQDDPQRQVDAFLRAVRLLACLAMPACLLQAALIEPMVHLVCPPKWWDTIILLQILSVGMALRAAGWPAIAMLQAQRRFVTRLKLAIASMLMLAVFAGAGVIIDQENPARGAAIGTLLQMLIIEPASLLIAVGPIGHAWRRVRQALAAPIILSVCCVVPAVAASMLIGPMPGQNIWRCAVIIAVTTVLYFPCFRLTAPDAWAEARARSLVLLRRKRPA